MYSVSDGEPVQMLEDSGDVATKLLDVLPLSPTEGGMFQWENDISAYPLYRDRKAKDKRANEETGGLR